MNQIKCNNNLSFCNRVDIPVIIMGETGCGKTKLIEFMSKLQVPVDLQEQITSMVIVKVNLTDLTVSLRTRAVVKYTLLN